MAGKLVKFKAVKVVQKPTVVKFRTKSGKQVTFKATKTVAKPVNIKFRAKK